MVPWGTRIPIPGISNHFRDNFTSWKQSTLLGKGQLCRSALRQRSFCQKAWHEGTVTHGARHTSSGPRSPLEGKGSCIFSEKSTTSCPGIRARVTSAGRLLRDPPCATDPKTSEESRNEQMKSAGRTSNMTGTGGPGRLQTTRDWATVRGQQRS